MATEPKVSALDLVTSNRRASDKAFDIFSSKDFGGVSDGVTSDTTAINNAISALATEYTQAVLILPPNTVYTESALVMNANVVVIDTHPLRILTKAPANSFPMLEGGLEIKCQQMAGMRLIPHELGSVDNPYLVLVHALTGQLAGLYSAYWKLKNYGDIEESASPSAPSANVARMFARDNGAGKTQLCVRFNTGAIQVISTEP